MGLDMWLEKRREVPSANPAVARQYQVEPVIQWRKANAIHAFFEAQMPEGIANCVEYPFGMEVIRQLVTTIVEAQEHPARAEELLPTMEGFFFGSTEYDEDYWEELAETRRVLTEALERAEPDDYFIYTAWW